MEENTKKIENVNEEVLEDLSSGKEEADRLLRMEETTIKNVEPKNNLVIALVFAIIVLAIASYFAYSYGNLKGQLSLEKNKNEKVITEDDTDKKTAEGETKTKEIADEIEGEEVRESGLVGVDSQWNRYTNYEMGFSIDIPRTAFSGEGDCEWKDTDGDHSYRPVIAEVPVVVTEDDEGVYIDFEYRKKLTEASVEDFVTYFSDCEEEENDIFYLEDERRTWNIIVAQVIDETELEDFIKERFGEGCRVGEQEETDQDGVMVVKIQGDGLDLGESACGINYMYKLYYVPQLNRVYTWDRGQSYKFASSEDMSTSYDEAMDASFRIILE